VDCNRHIAVEGLVTSFNDGKTIGPSPYVSIRKEALKQVILLMNELGLTPKSRLAKPSSMPSSTLEKLMLGPQVKR
jgi:phage terminase small subunit